MGHEKQICMRVTEALLKRVDKLVKAVNKDAHYQRFASGELSRSATLRLLLMYGLEAMEGKYQKPKKSRKQRIISEGIKQDKRIQRS
jgi:hypothetical protein